VMVISDFSGLNLCICLLQNTLLAALLTVPLKGKVIKNIELIGQNSFLLNQLVAEYSACFDNSIEGQDGPCNTYTVR
jgi:hypothetical protein